MGEISKEQKVTQEAVGNAHYEYADFGMEEIRELLGKGQYTRLRQVIQELNDADIADYMEDMEEEEL